ncbi:MAG TPA: CDP-alcohol phosphatidyltransferase family protein, partial [Verrucomicrobiae bacterium]|nr:CDP-alcohol phosphatidyltransferase family protein [Verrucomicrobiae bacterium]
MTTMLMNLPNLLTAVRIPLVPVMLYLAWTGTGHVFNALLILSLLIDAVDGWLARRLNCAGEFGARLDSWADLVTWLALPICAWWLNPDALRREMPFLAVAVGFYLVAVGIGLVKFRRLTSYHTRGAKFMAMAAAVAVGIFFLARTGMALRVLTPVVVL